ncbi:MAG: TolC family protein, partial [Muribaculaceae bacterium]|nr:TolC family protein [Muribaculaceae bacterium]
MNNLRLLAGLFSAVLLSGGVCSHGQSVISLEQIFEMAETSGAQLRPSLSAVDEARSEISVARSGLLPEINASLSVSYIGDGFTTRRNFSDFQKAPIPHLGTGLGLTVEQPIYTGGAVTSAIRLAELKSTAARYASELQRDNIRFQLTGFYLDIYKYTNLRSVVVANIEAARKVLADMNARLGQGTALPNDITRYELLVANLNMQLTRIDNTLRILNSNLVTVAGLPDTMVVVPDSAILERTLPAQGEQWWRSEAEASSPSLALARSGVDISRRAEALVRSERRPKVGLRAGWTIDGPILVE